MREKEGLNLLFQLQMGLKRYTEEKHGYQKEKEQK